MSSCSNFSWLLILWRLMIIQDCFIFSWAQHLNYRELWKAEWVSYMNYLLWFDFFFQNFIKRCIICPLWLTYLLYVYLSMILNNKFELRNCIDIGVFDQNVIYLQTGHDQILKCVKMLLMFHNLLHYCSYCNMWVIPPDYHFFQITLSCIFIWSHLDAWYTLMCNQNDTIVIHNVIIMKCVKNSL